MDVGNKTLDLNIQTANEKLKAQVQFCQREKERFRKCNSQDSTTFYEEKLQEFKWQMLQLQKHYESTGEVLRLKRNNISVPVAADNDRLSDDQLELDISDVFYNPTTESKKLYFLRFVICQPLQKHVLQEQKTDFFRTCELKRVEGKRIFHYPRNDIKMCESLKRGYLTVELYAERKLKAPTLVGIPQRVSLNRFLDEHSIKGMLSFGDKGEWDISYTLNIRRAQLKEERDNFKMVEKSWIGLAAEHGRLARRATVASMNASPNSTSKHHHRKRSSRNHHRHHRHRHHHHKESKEKSGTRLVAVQPTDSIESFNEENCDRIADLMNQSTDSENSDNSENSLHKEESSDHIADLPSEKSENKNTTNKIKKTLARRFSGFF